MVSSIHACDKYNTLLHVRWRHRWKTYKWNSEKIRHEKWKTYVIQVPFLHKLNKVAITIKMCAIPCNKCNITIYNTCHSEQISSVLHPSLMGYSNFMFTLTTTVAYYITSVMYWPWTASCIHHGCHSDLGLCSLGIQCPCCQHHYSMWTHHHSLLQLNNNIQENVNNINR